MSSAKKQRLLDGTAVWMEKSTLDTWAERAEKRRRKRKEPPALVPMPIDGLTELTVSEPPPVSDPFELFLEGDEWSNGLDYLSGITLSPLPFELSTEPRPSAFSTVMPTFPLTCVPVEKLVSTLVAIDNASTSANSIPPVPMPIQPPVHIEATDDAPVTQCQDLGFVIDHEKTITFVCGVNELMIRLFEERTHGQPIDQVPTPLLAAIASAVFHCNHNFAEHRHAGEQCRQELERRLAAGSELLKTDIGCIKRTRGNASHDLWALYHCFSRCAQCDKHTTLHSPSKATNGNVRIVEFYTRRCGCALRYCASCVQKYYVDKSTRMKDVICWMCNDNQEYGFDHHVVKVPIGNCPKDNDETRQHAGCLFEPCNECRGNTRHAEAYLPEETRKNLDLFRHRLKSARQGTICSFETNTTVCSFCNNGHSQGRYWTFEGCKCKGVSTRPTYHMKCARTLATAFESTCPVCGHMGYYKFNDRGT